jgi:hypothetical protein
MVRADIRPKKTWVLGPIAGFYYYTFFKHENNVSYIIKINTL